MSKIGYGHLVDIMELSVRPLKRFAQTSTSVNRRQDTSDRILFPSGVAITDTPVGHLEFALRHEGVNLEVIDAAFEKIDPALLIARLHEAPNSDPIRRACFLWEWIRGESLDAGIAPSGGYVDLFPADQYAVAAKPVKAPAFRVNNNALGNRDFCPIVKIETIANAGNIRALINQVPGMFVSLDDAAIYARAIRYLYLSETRNSFAIEKEVPNASKEERFVSLLAHAGEQDQVSEDWLVSLQNVVIKDVYSQEASYRGRQNWLEDAAGRITFLPPSPKDLPALMRGWESFVNDKDKGIDLSLKIACSAFGFVYLHPFMDGNGRLHRFMIHHVLQQAGLLPDGVVLPVSASIAKNIPDYLGVLSGFSKPTTRLWEYKRADDGPVIVSGPGGRPYRYFEADAEVLFMQKMIQTTILTEIPNQLRFLAAYDHAFDALNKELDLPQPDLSALIRMISGNNGRLSNTKRKRYAHLPDCVIGKIEAVVRDAFADRSPPEVESGPGE
jgi:hypothetical protein